MLDGKVSKEAQHAEVSQQTKGNAESDAAIIADDEDRTSLFVWL